MDTTAATANRKSVNGRGSSVVNEINGSGVVNVTSETNGTNGTDRTNRKAFILIFNKQGRIQKSGGLGEGGISGFFFFWGGGLGRRFQD